MESGSSAFERSGTVGIEEEFYVVDEGARPVSGTDELVYESTPPEILDGHLDHELFKCVIETQTRTCETLGEANEQFRAVREALVSHAESHGYRIAAAGLHPLANWRELEHAEKPRYRSQLDRIQYPQHRNTTAGIHVHVGVDDAEKATWIANEVRWSLPPLLALSANSPYWCGFDTGLASARAKVFEALPNTGMPTAFGSFEEYLDFERAMVEHDSIADRGELWYDVRPHTENGTVEVRTPDGNADPDVVFAFVEYVHALVLDLAEDYENGREARPVRRELLDENKWRAMRYGREASFLRRDLRGEISLAEFVASETDRLDVSGLEELHERGSFAARQRELRGDEDALCASLLL